MTLATVEWPDVVIALIAGLPGILAAVTALLVRKEVHTGNGTTLAATVEQATKHAAETKAVVTRTLGQRHSDPPTNPAPRVEGTRDSDGAAGE